MVDNLIGKRFGKLVVISKGKKPNSKDNHAYWICKCDCGNTTLVASNSLKLGRTTSCGCYGVEMRNKQGGKNKIHGETYINKKKTKLYRTWANIKARCYNENNKSYVNYGYRGIKMCDEWKNDFSTFRDWSINNGYNDNLSIDRIDNNGDYTPENCRWTTTNVQQNNKRSNHIVIYNGKQYTVANLCKVLNIPYGRTLDRINAGYTIEEAVQNIKFSTHYKHF